MKEKGVSEVVGYVLILGILTTFITFAYVFAIPSIENQKDNVEFENAKNLMIQLTEKINTVALISLPNNSEYSKSIDIPLSPSLYLYEGAKINISADGFQKNTTIQSLIYESPKGIIGYENTGCFLASSQNSLVLVAPRVSFLEDSSGNLSVYIPLVKIEMESSSAYGRVLVRSLESNHSLIDASNFHLRIESERFAKAWEEHLRGELENINTSYTISRNGNVVEVNVSGTMKIFLTEYRVKLIS
jgi:hypothetical protein